MNADTATILLVEDNPGDAALIDALLEDAAGTFHMLHAARLGEAEALLGSDQGADIDLVLLDLGLPDSVGIKTFTRLSGRHPEVPIVVLTGLEDVEVGSMAVQGGAQDYLVKGKADADLLSRSITYGIQRHRMLRKMERNVSYLTTILETSCDGIIVVDPLGFIRDLNPATEQLLGLGRDELLGQRFGVPGAQPGGTLLGILQPSVGPAGAPGHRRALAEMRRVDMVWEDGPMHLVLLHDVTESWLMRDQLEQVVQRWRSTFNAVDDMIMVLDRDLHVEAANRATYEALDGPVITNASCHTLLHGHGCPNDENCPARNTLKTGEATRTDHHLLEAGKRCIEELAYPITGVTGEVENVVLVVRDVTDQRQAERDRRSLDAKTALLEQMRRINEAKTYFMDMVTHEMRTPMTAIGSGVGLLLSEQLGPLSERQHKFLTMMDRNIKRLRRFSRDVLSLSRLEADKYPLHLKELPLGPFLPPIVDLMLPMAEDRGISMVLEAGDPTLRAYVDEDALSQVMTNLLTNALIHCPAGTSVRIWWGEVTREQVEVMVADDGPGMPAETVDSLFERFAQADNSEKRHVSLGKEGAGLGLAVSKVLLDRMGGSIEVESVLDKGTTFRLALLARAPTPQ